MQNLLNLIRSLLSYESLSCYNYCDICMTFKVDKARQFENGLELSDMFI